MDFIVLDKVLTTLSFITPFMLYAGMILALSMNTQSYKLCYQYFHRFIFRLKEDLLLNKRFLERLHMKDHKNHTKSASKLFHRINQHR